MPEKKIDRLSALIQHFRISANVLPPIDEAHLPHAGANLFVLAQGKLVDPARESPELDIPTPALVFFPHGAPKGLIYVSETGEDEYVCASVDTGHAANPISQALPDLVTITLDEAGPLRAPSDMLLEEALAPRCGGKAVIDRLCEIVVIRMLRHLIETSDMKVGLVAGLAHPNLARAIVAIHDAPEKSWSLEDLAHICAMSRSQFATVFKETVGVSPGEYLSNWRLTLARIELANGATLKSVVGKVGFSSAAALSRAFKRHFGMSPRELGST